MKSAEQRFMEKVGQPDANGCWLWMASLNHAGYGQFRIGDTMRGSHRVAYEHFVGPIPAGLVLDHLCRVPRCVNPAHLEPVTTRENTLRGLLPLVTVLRHAAKTHCAMGHEFSETNVYRDPRTGRRGCRTCRSARSLAHQLVKRGKRAA